MSVSALSAPEELRSSNPRTSAPIRTSDRLAVGVAVHLARIDGSAPRSG
jgi:hypothetical protein